MLIQDPKDLSVKGGGTVDITQRTELASHWKYRADIGGNIKFNANIDSKAEKNGNTYSTIVSLLSNALLDYENDPFEWENKILVDEGFNFSGLQVADLATDVDEFRFSSLFIWRFLPWFGPYGRTEVITNFLPRRINRGDNYKYFCILDSSYYVKSREGFDSSMTFQLNPSFSPLTFDIGFGANADLIGTNIFESKLRIGFGSSFSSYPDRFNEVLQDKALWRTPQDSLLYESFLQKSRTVLPQSRASIIELGPQTALNMMLRIGWFATATAELNIFAPIAPELRFMRPDFDLTTTLSWQLSHWVTLDYKYSYMLKQPSDPNLQVDRQSHGVTLRLQFTSR